jgi:hypothetical protein
MQNFRLNESVILQQKGIKAKKPQKFSKIFAYGEISTSR